MNQRRLRTVAAVLALSSVLGREAFAWGPLAHRAVARIAHDRLSSETRRKVDGLLGAADGLERVASCADAILHERGTIHCGGLVSLPADAAKVTKDWHYMNVPVGARVSESDLPRHCPEGTECVWAQIDLQIRALRRETGAQQRKVALMFLVHLAGDLHQPLHVADNHDHGGTEARVEFGDIRKSLHQVWDGVVQLREWASRPAWTGPFDPVRLDKQVAADLPGLMDRLNADLARADTGSWLQGDPKISAVLEGHDIAANVIYPEQRRTQGRIDESYQDRMQPIAFERLERAGVRLAAWLEEAFGPEPRYVDAGAVGARIDAVFSKSR
ncbi:MAG: hypothetical protein HY553_11580 [Elusimicrobia bacterium]|nr:hypothetical protein [Elusimicrobiota bacterium]